MSDNPNNQENSKPRPSPVELKKNCWDPQPWDQPPAPEPKKKWWQKAGDAIGNALGEWFMNR